MALRFINIKSEVRVILKNFLQLCNDIIRQHLVMLTLKSYTFTNRAEMYFYLQTWHHWK